MYSLSAEVLSVANFLSYVLKLFYLTVLFIALCQNFIFFHHCYTPKKLRVLVPVCTGVVGHRKKLPCGRTYLLA